MGANNILKKYKADMLNPYKTYHAIRKLTKTPLEKVKRPDSKNSRKRKKLPDTVLIHKL